MEPQPHRPHGLLHSKLPLGVALGAFFVFLLTLNRWVSILSLPTLVHAGGWDWLPPTYQPLSYLVTLPVRWLPAGWQPFALNLLAAGLGAGTLGLLARSVILLPHDRTREQRRVEQSEHSLLSVPSAWLPPVFAAAVAGLQLTFWEHATSFSGEMLDLFVFAFCIWSLLEFRLDRREPRLARMALVYGLGVANNFALIGFFPAFLAALVWIRGREFFQAGFIVRMTACGVAGLGLYLLLPLLSLMGDSTYSFWQILKTNLVSQKNILVGYPKYVILLLSLTSLVPLLGAGIRWPSSFGETTGTGELLARVGFHALHALFLAACLVVAFDPKFSPRQLGLGLPFLTLYYLGALCAGYFTGYFLLVFHPRALRHWGKRSLMADAAKQALSGVLVAAALAVPVGLTWKNAPIIRATNGPGLREFAEAKVAKLPAAGAVLLADDPVNLRLVEAALRGQGRAKDFVFADTRLLPNLAYERHLARRHPDRWPAEVHNEKLPPVLDSPSLINVLISVARSNSVYYLHPSFGYYFEAFHLVPHGMIYELKPYAAGTVAPPPMVEAAIRENAQFWQQLSGSMGDVLRHADPRNSTLVALGRNYSLGLNHWGVELQRAGQLEAAGKLFDLALQLNNDNASASLNLEYNRNLRKGVRQAIEVTRSVTDRFGKFRTWDAVLAANGPIDEPAIALRLGHEFARNTQFRQAAIQYLRVTQLTPGNPEAQLAYAAALVEGQMPDLALGVAAELRAPGAALSITQKSQLARLEARAHAAKGDLAKAEAILRAARREFPQDDSLLDSLSQMYLIAGKFKEALAMLDEQLKLTPDNPRALLNKGALAIQLKDYAAAIPPLNRVLESQPRNNAARMNRGIALLQTGRFDDALKDYGVLRDALPEQFSVHYGLGEIAWHKQQFTAALEHYREYLRLAPPTSDEAGRIRKRVEELQARGGK